MKILIPLIALAIATPAAAQSTNIGDLRWLSGCWEMKRGERLTEEQWMSPRGGVMIGMSRTVRADSLIEFEQVRIEQRAPSLVYVASPARQATAEFTATSASSSQVTFENPAHDFPQKITYRKQGADSLIASIAGPRGGTIRTIEYPYRRVSCP